MLLSPEVHIALTIGFTAVGFRQVATSITSVNKLAASTLST